MHKRLHFCYPYVFELTDQVPYSRQNDLCVIIEMHPLWFVKVVNSC